MARRALIAGWFSFPDGEATAGDLGAARVVAAWLRSAGVAHDVAYSPAFGDALTLERADPSHYSDLIFVCGPASGRQLEVLLQRFSHCRRLAVGVSCPDRSCLELFDSVLARDGLPGEPVRPDLALLDSDTVDERRDRWPTVAFVAANEQPEYGSAARHREVHEVIEEFLADQPVAVLDVDTRIDPRSRRQRSANQVTGVLAKADLVVSTRLHGLVLGLSQHRPVVAVDPILGGAKVAAQCAALKWPAVVLPEELDYERLADMLAFCQGPTSDKAVADSLRVARRRLQELGADFEREL